MPVEAGGGKATAYNATIETGPPRTAEEQAAHVAAMKAEYVKSLRLFPKSPPKRKG